MSVHKKKRGGKYYVSFRDQSGVQHTKVFGTGLKAKKEATAFDVTLQGRPERGSPPGG